MNVVKWIILIIVTFFLCSWSILKNQQQTILSGVEPSSLIGGQEQKHIVAIEKDDRQQYSDLPSRTWILIDDNEFARMHVDKNSIQSDNFEGNAIVKAVIKYDYKNADNIFGPEVTCAVLQVWINPKEHSFRIVRRENFDRENRRLAARWYSIKGIWEDYTMNERWRLTMEEVAERTW
jgi:hypothetical protein